MRPILTILAALTLSACGGGGELPADQSSTPAPAPVTLAPATPVVCQIVIDGVVKTCGS